MNSQQEKTSPASERPSFWGLPRRFPWSEGPKFWGGVVFGAANGFGFGLLIGAGLVEEGVIAPESGRWPVVIALVLLWIGVWMGRVIASRAGAPRGERH